MKRSSTFFSIFLLLLLFTVSVRAEPAISALPKSTHNLPGQSIIYQENTWVVKKIFSRLELIPGYMLLDNANIQIFRFYERLKTAKRDNHDNRIRLLGKRFV